LRRLNAREFALGSDRNPEATGKHHIWDGGGQTAHWGDDRKELIYVSNVIRTFMSVDIAVMGDAKLFLAADPVGLSKSRSR
jgi:hypothetical protein